MNKALILILTLLAFIATPAAGLARETSASAPGQTEKTVKKAKKATGKDKKAQVKKSGKKKLASAKKSGKKKLASAKTKKKIAAKKQSRAKTKLSSAKRAQARAMAEMGAPYTGGELALRSAVAMVVDQKTGEPLYAKNPDTATPIASITKLMTAMVSLDAGLALHEEVTIDAEDVDRLKHTRSRLAVGTTLTREELMHLALIASENRAAAALSRAYPGGREAFVAAMNRKARALGMENTHFVDGTGLSSGNRSTAADLVKLVDTAYRYPLIRKISTTGNYDVLLDGKQVRHLAFVNTNQLTRREDWAIGVSKTGYINEAGHCLVMQAEIAQQKVIIVLLDSWGKLSRIGDANRIRKWLEMNLPGKFADRSGKTSV